MKDNLKYVIWVLILLIGGVIGWQLTNAFTPDCPQVKRDTLKIPFDTTAFVAKLKPIIKTEYRDTGSIKWKDNIILIPYPAESKEDSAKVYTAYYSTKFGNDTIVNDPNLFMSLKYGITQNRLKSAEGKYFWKQPVKIITNTISNPPTNQLYIGFGTGTDFKNAFKIGGEVTLKTKKDNLWSFRVEKISNISKPVYSVFHDFKIKL
jgi:hypothetical protein